MERRAEGEKKKQYEIARKMKTQGCDMQLIIDCTGLSTEEIEEL